MTASAGTSSTRPAAAKPVTIRPVAVLLCSTAVTPRPAANAEARLRSARAEHGPQPGAEGALHAGLHHVHAPEQERDGAGEVEQGAGKFHGAPSAGKRAKDKGRGSAGDASGRAIGGPGTLAADARLTWEPVPLYFEIPFG